MATVGFGGGLAFAGRHEVEVIYRDAHLARSMSGRAVQSLRGGPGGLRMLHHDAVLFGWTTVAIRHDGGAASGLGRRQTADRDYYCHTISRMLFALQLGPVLRNSWSDLGSLSFAGACMHAAAKVNRLDARCRNAGTS